MKQYIILFLLLLSINVYAPNLSNAETFKPEVENSITKSKIEHNETKAIKISKRGLRVIKKLNYEQFKNSEQFTNNDRDEITDLCNELEIKEEWLYKVIYIESRGFTNKSNPYTHAVGLIGFMPKTAKVLGTSTEELKRMTVSEQLKFVKKYLILQSNGRKLKSLADVYFTVFYPAAICKADNFVLGDRKISSRSIYNQNPALRHETDSVITVKGIKNKLAILFM